MVLHVANDLLDNEVWYKNMNIYTQHRHQHKLSYKSLGNPDANNPDASYLGQIFLGTDF